MRLQVLQKFLAGQHGFGLSLSEGSKALLLLQIGHSALSMGGLDSKAQCRSGLKYPVERRA